MAGLVHIEVIFRCVTPVLGTKIDKEARRATLVRSPENEIVWLPSWWRPALDLGAKSAGAFQSMIRQVYPDPVIQADVGEYHRELADGRAMVHEAITNLLMAKFLVPAEMAGQAFANIIETGARLRGIHPQDWARNYGRLAVYELR